MGLLRTYTLPLSLPIEGGRFEDASTAGVWFTIIEFDTEANAALMFDMADDDIESGNVKLSKAPSISAKTRF